MAARQDLTIVQGKTFTRVLRWESLPFIYKAISSITQAAPAVVNTSASHGVPDGWRVAIVSVQGMEEINASTPPKEREFVKATVLTGTSLELNSVNSSEYTAYTTGGYVQYYTPVALSGYTARMQVKDKVGGTVLASTDVDDAPKDVITVTVDDVTKTITIAIAATDTAAFAWKKGVYDLEMVSGSGEVTALLTGNISVTAEVTTAT